MTHDSQKPSGFSPPVDALVAHERVLPAQPDDVLLARLTGMDDETKAQGDEIRVSGSLGAQLLLWEAATAVAGRRWPRSM